MQNLNSSLVVKIFNILINASSINMFMSNIYNYKIIYTVLIKKFNFAFLKRNIKYFKFNLRNTFITDKGLQYFKGVHTINLSDCDQITDGGLEYLKGVHTINLNGCNKITDKGLEYLKGVHIIDLSYCNK